jgi:hypothetical protein
MSAHLPRVLCVYPRLEVGPEEGGGLLVLPAPVLLVPVERLEEDEEEGEMYALAVVPVPVLGLERVCVVRHRTKETGETARKARLDTRQRQRIRWGSVANL